jgi:hypothetical protein
VPDLRAPIGWLFLILGLALTGYGLFGDRSIYGPSQEINVNLWWGLVLAVFGVAMLMAARRARVS